MAKKKYYAVRCGVKPGIYQTWEECELQVKGFSGAKYKSFLSLKEAEDYMMGSDSMNAVSGKKDSEETIELMNGQVEKEIRDLKEGEVIAFVDGSYNPTEEKSGFGVIIVDDKGLETQLYKAFTKQLSAEFLKLGNVAAELEGVKEAINWAIGYNKKRIKVYYDYEGIGCWADGSWKADKGLTQQYVTFLKDKRAFISVEFCKVPAHAGIEYNEKADALAKRSLLEKGYKTYNDGSVYFVGFSCEEWETIICCINDENNEVLTGNKEAVKIQETTFDNRRRLDITDSKNKVVINCYQNCRSYVQGKQSVLFQKIISTAIELMKNEQIVIETLNRVHALTLTKEEIEVQFETMLPHYNENRSGKLYNNLLSAVYNTMLVGYMPDYTSLITPIFRAYEYYLHKILGEKMQLNTCDKNGKNNFGFFDKDSNGRFNCNSSNIFMLKNQQENYLNDLYNTYNGIRHPYSHWSADDYDTAVITSMDVAREYIMKGLTLIDKYYTLF